MTGGSLTQESEYASAEHAEHEEDETESAERGRESTEQRVARGGDVQESRADEEQHRHERTDEQREPWVDPSIHVWNWRRLGGKASGCRAQANLPALAVALLVLTTTAGLAFSLADSAYADASRDATDRRLAVGLAERLVAADSPTTVRAGVLDARAVANLTADRFTEAFPASSDVAIRLRVGDRTILERGSPRGGVTARRIVLVADRQRVTRPLPAGNNQTTLPRRTEHVTVQVDPGQTRVRTVRANGRVVLHDPGGLNGTYTVAVSRYETATLAFETDGPIAPGRVTLTYTPRQTTKAVVEVTVDA
jgi:hypothetical protein